MLFKQIARSIYPVVEPLSEKAGAGILVVRRSTRPRSGFNLTLHYSPNAFRALEIASWLTPSLEASAACEFGIQHDFPAMDSRFLVLLFLLVAHPEGSGGGSWQLAGNVRWLRGVAGVLRIGDLSLG